MTKTDPNNMLKFAKAINNYLDASFPKTQEIDPALLFKVENDQAKNETVFNISMREALQAGDKRFVKWFANIVSAAVPEINTVGFMSEGYKLYTDHLSVDDAQALYKKTIEEYGSIQDSPNCIETITFSMDDGENTLFFSRDIVKNDLGKRILLPTEINEECISPTTATDATFNGLRKIGLAIRDLAEQNANAQQKTLSKDEYIKLIFASVKSIAERAEEEEMESMLKALEASANFVSQFENNHALAQQDSSQQAAPNHTVH